MMSMATALRIGVAGVSGKKIKFKTLTECSKYNHTSFLLKLY